MSTAKDNISLADLKDGRSAKIVSIDGGKNMQQKLSNIGIRTGSNIKKISSQLMKGPTTISAGSCTVSIGHGMASKITVEEL